MQCSPYDECSSCDECSCGECGDECSSCDEFDDDEISEITYPSFNKEDSKI
jgi:hypothetical protein